MPFIRHAFPDDNRFMQDNDPKHTSILGRDTKTENNINWWKTPPIENMWHELKVNLRSRVKPRPKDELLNDVQSFWLTVTPEKCQNILDISKSSAGCSRTQW